jgi:hypothetical protein
MASITITLTTGKSHSVEMSAEDLKAALAGTGALARLPLRGGQSLYVNPIHIVTASESVERGPEPMGART